MAFDPSSIPKDDLRPINVARVHSEEVRVSGAGSGPGRNHDGFYANPPRSDVTSPHSAPVYFTIAAPDAGFVNLGLGNPTPNPVPATNLGQAPALPMWAPRFPAPVISQGIHPTTSGYMTNPNVGATRTGSHGIDQASDDGSEDSVSRRKIKFLCSFGGRILPRPCDGMLRYVGGQTRIITVRKDVSFNELVQKMTDTYGQPVAIKYQLPDEDLDALVSVSCPDDLENMMEEYEKLFERSADGSSKLRLFLFSASELDSFGMAQFEDLNDSGQKYVDAVNGVMDGVGGGITRKESIASVTSTQNSDLSGPEPVDNLHPSQEASAPVSVSNVSADPGIGSNTTSTIENFSRLNVLDANQNVLTSESSTVSLVAPVGSGPPLVAPSLPKTSSERLVSLPSQQQLLMDYDLPPQHSTGNFPPPPRPYLQGFVDPRAESLSCTTTEYQKIPSQVTYGNHPSVVTARPIVIQPHYHDTIPGAVPQQFVPAVRMTMAPPSTHLSMNPSMFQQMMQSQRAVAVPADQSYGAFQTQIPHGAVPGFNWHPVPPHEHIVCSESWVPYNQRQVIMPENIPRMDDCNMCQKQLPHAHSDSIVPDQGRSNTPNSIVADANSLYRSLRMEDVARVHMINQAVVTTQTEEPGLPQASYGVMVGKVSNTQPEDSVQHLVPQVKPHVADDNAVGGVPFVATEATLHETTYSGHGPVFGEECFSSNISHEYSRPVEGIMEQLCVSQPETLYAGDQSKSSPVDQPRIDDKFDKRLQLMLPNPAYSNRALVPEPNSIHPVVSHTDLEPVGGNNTPSPVSPSKWNGNIQESANSLFSNQDPFYFRHDSHFPPPRPTKITAKREVAGQPGPGDPQYECRPANNGDQNVQGHFVDPSSLPSSNLTKDYGSDQTLSTKGSSEDLIRQELQATAEGIAASVLQSSGSSNVNNTPASDANRERGTENNSDSLIQSRLEGISVKSEKANPGFPLADGLGRLQIIKNGDLEELRELGSGTFGTVYHGKWRGTDVAIKRINDRCFAGKPSEQERMREDFWNEAINLADLHHPNVVAFYGVVVDGPGGSVATVTEYMVNGSLRTALQKNERTLDNRKRLLIALDVAFGMEYLHSRNIVHFDLKSDNLLVNLRDPHRPICKVGDLGLSKVKCQTLISGGVRGTLPWMAPELLNGSSSLVSEKVDVFSYGIVMWELITGEEPYADLHYGAIIGGIVSNTLRPPVPDHCNPDWKSLMERCWSAEPSERPTFTEIANELRSMAAKLPPKVQNQASNPRTTANAQGGI